MTENRHLRALRGARSQKEYNVLLKDFSALPALSLDAKAWQIAWETAFLSRQRGLNIPALDTLIASIAIRHGVTLMHSDRHYDLLSRHTSLKTVAL
jgi:predicted nucleic acid-binding protein